MSPSEEIIDFYRKAVKKKKGIPEETVTENVYVTPSIEPSSDDPLENFLFKLTGILKSAPPVIEENTEESSLAIIEEVKTAITETVEENDKEPLENFLLKLSDILQTQSNITEAQERTFKPLFDDKPEKTFKPLFDDEPNIKNAALDLINNLKNSGEPDNQVKEEPVPVKRIEKALPQKNRNPQNKSSYVDELRATDKDSKIPKIEPKDPLRDKIEKLVREILSKQRMGIVSEGGGGDGNFSTEFKNGGTMHGSLNVTGQYLSGGIDLFNLLGGGGGGGGSSDRLISGPQSLILHPDGTISFPEDIIRTGDTKLLSMEAETMSLSAFTKIALSGNAFYAYDSNGNIITFDSTDNNIVLTTLNTYDWKFGNDGKFSGPGNILEIGGDINTSHKILSGGVDLANIFLTTETDAQTLSWNSTAYELSISNGNTVSLSSLSAMGGGGGGPTDRLINGSYQAVLSSNGDLTLPGAIVTASNSKLDLVGFGPNTAYLTTTPDDTTALFMGVDPVELRANNYVSIATNTGDVSRLWTFGADSSLRFPDNTTQTTAFTGNPDLSPYAKSDQSLYTTDSPTFAGLYTYNGDIFIGDLGGHGGIRGQNDIEIDTEQGLIKHFSQFSNTGGDMTFLDPVILNSNLNVSGPVRINNNLTVFGDLTATGTTTFANTIFSVTSALSVVHVGDGPAVWIGNRGLGDIASFWDIDLGIEVFHIGGNNGTYPNVGVKTSTPNKDFTVNGEISATSTIYANSYLSAGVNLLDIFSSSGGGATPIKRFDYVTVSNIDYSYSGTAPYGTADNIPIWKLTRLTYANNGTVSNSASATNSWTGRLTAAYV